MHGQRRAEYKARQKDPKVAAVLQRKADHWRQLTAKLSEAPPALAWELTETLLRVNPDPLYIWNQRRALISSSDGDQDVKMDYDLDKELGLTAAALQSNPKAYGAWFHRKWILCRQQSQGPREKMADILRQELGLTELFLQRDERNFHCWNYRRFVVSLRLVSAGCGVGDGSWKLSLAEGDDPQIVMGAQVAQSSRTETDAASATSTTTSREILTQEWNFTLTKIRQNFSNFSAFHQRSKLLPLLSGLSTINLADELQIVEDAVYTEPDDQTAWWYQAFLLDFAFQHDTDNVSLDEDRISQHLDALSELAEEVTECKWVRLGMLACWHRLSASQTDRKKALWEELIALDPDRATRYKHMLSKLH